MFVSRFFRLYTAVTTAIQLYTAVSLTAKRHSGPSRHDRLTTATGSDLRENFHPLTAQPFLAFILELFAFLGGGE
jgi:hypothetical protein